MPVPNTGDGPDLDFLVGLASRGDRVISLLQLEGLFDIDADRYPQK